MALTHVNQNRRSRQPEPQPEPPSGFETSFAPPPSPVSAVSDAVARPTEPVAPLAPSYGTVTDNVKILSPVSSSGQMFAVGSVVQAICFPELERLLKLGVVSYTYEGLSSSPVDETVTSGMRVAQPIMPPLGLPQTPWNEGSIYDILGPAIPRATRSPAPVIPSAPYTQVQGEFGQTLVVANPTPKPPYEGAATLQEHQLDAGSEALLADPETNKGKTADSSF